MDPESAKMHVILTSQVLVLENFLNLYYNKDLGIKNSYLIQYLSTDVNTAVSTSALKTSEECGRWTTDG